jgi:glycine hydroxymethyltransferase
LEINRKIIFLLINNYYKYNLFYRAITPGGIRIGTPAVTTRGMVEKDMQQIAEFIHRVAQICVETQKKSGKNLKQFISSMENESSLKALAKEIEVI